MATIVRAGGHERRGLALSTPGFVILAHENLDRVADLARYLSLHGPVVIHVDTRVSHAGLKDLGARVEVISIHACEWGMIGLVDATLDCVRHLLAHSDVSHICLLSGSCIPIRPLDQLADFLEAHSETDFIETVSASEADWVQGGLGAERFSLWFPVGWKRHRRLFDLLVWLQRKLGIRRKAPEGLEPHLGLQWWCLTSDTLRIILEHPDLQQWRRYFAWTWIPDEGFFQTIVPHIAQGAIKSRTLTLQRFDHKGRPFVFHDDHVDLLKTSGCFFARKIDRDADALYARYLSESVSGASQRRDFENAVDEAPFDDARKRGWEGGLGLLSAAKMTSGTAPAHVETVRPYAVIVSHNSDLMREVRKAHMGSEIRFHGRLFGAFPADFSDDFSEVNGLGPGSLPTEPVQRDYRAAQYLAKTLWIGRDRPAAFLFSPDDQRLIRGTILSDPNARLILLGDAAALLAELGAPLINKRGREMRPSARRAWHRSVPDDDSAAIQQTLGALTSDWEDPAGWNLLAALDT